ncbi:MAG: hypothetical protein HDQ96_02410 [Lachnospiraceae bacterium]|nr:hypothetical protein [Lachnospiraceae bacterium]
MNNKWKSNKGLKAALVIISILMAAAIAGSIAAIIVFDDLGVYNRSKEETLEKGYERYSEIYSVMAVANRDNKYMQEDLDKTNFRYGIIKAEDLEAVDISDSANYEFCNFETMPKRNAVGDGKARAYQFWIGPDTAYSWDCSLYGYGSVYERAYAVAEEYVTLEETKQVSITGYYYNVSDGIFYYETDDEYYRVDTVELPVGVNGNSIEFVYDSGQKAYYQSSRDGVIKDYYVTFDRYDATNNSWETWEYIILDGLNFNHTEIRFVNDESTDSGEFNGKPIADCFYSLEVGSRTLNVKVKNDSDVDAVEEKSDKRESYWVVSQVLDPLQKTGDLYDQITFLVNYAYVWRYPVVAVWVISVILWIASTLLVLIMAGHKGSYVIVEMQGQDAAFLEASENSEEEDGQFKESNTIKTERRFVDAIKPGFWQKIPLDVETCVIMTLGVLALVFMSEMTYYRTSLWNFTVLAVCVAFCYILCYIWLADFVIRVKLGKWWRSMFLYRFMRWIGRKMKRIFMFLQENISLLWKAILILGGISLLEFFGIFITAFSPEAELILWFIYRAATLVLILLGIVQMHKLKEGAKKLAEGNLQEKVKTEKMFWEFKKHGDTLNSINDGISLAVEKRMQSEHFRTELITNVSHDIKTPLTSIINYVDLLQKEETDNEKVKEYLEVLSRQSARLKKLTEDLLEASKASTGSMPVQLERLELGVFLTQTVGEFEEKMAAADLHIVMHKPEQEIFVNADGKHLWRVVENLVQNICKYAQPQTRVYIDLDDQEKEAVISFKNISRYELNISGEELMERFVRGDASRHTEGSGLGLSIAGSLMELMHGKLEIVVDGDLFKVVLHFPK